MKRIPAGSSVFAGLMLIVSAHVAVAAGGRTPLSEAIKNGDTAAIRTLVKGQGSVNVADADGTTPLHWATDKGDLPTAKLLIATGAQVSAKNRYGVTPIYSAAVAGDEAMIALLLTAGADANVALPEGETALMTASRTGKIDAIKLLIAHGAAVNSKEKWKQQTALMWAANEGNTEAVKVLIAAGANVDDRSIFGWTAYLLAARQGNIDTIEALLGAGVDVNQTLPDGTSALITATQGLNYEAAAVLLKYGINPNASGQGWTALHQIAWSRRPQRGQNNPGQKPKGSVSSLDLAKLLVEHGADVNARETKEPHTDMEGRNNMNRTGATPLLLASKSCDVPLVETLLALGADPFISTVEGTSPLMAAAGVGIFSQGESPGEPEESAEAVKIFLSLGASATDVDKNGETALHGPAWRGSNEAVTLLVNAGAKLDARNNRGWQPLTIADGVYINARVMMMPHTAKLLRELMNARGLNTEEKDTNFGGAMRDRAVVDDQLNGQSPAEIQRKLVEQQQKQQQEATKKLQQLEGIGK
jgi:uncharacterized protein